MSKTNKKRLFGLVGGLAALLVLVAVFLVINHKAQTYQDDQAAKDKEMIFTLTADQIDKVSYQAADGSPLAFTRTEKGDWTADQKPDTKLDQSKVGALVSGFTGVTLKQTIKDVKDRSVYGLDQPRYTCSFTDKDGKTTKFYIGSTNDAANVSYLYLDQDPGTVYAAASSIEQELQGKTDLSAFLPAASDQASVSGDAAAKS